MLQLSDAQFSLRSFSSEPGGAALGVREMLRAGAGHTPGVSAQLVCPLGHLPQQCQLLMPAVIPLCLPLLKSLLYGCLQMLRAIGIVFRHLSLCVYIYIHTHQVHIKQFCSISSGRRAGRRVEQCVICAGKGREQPSDFWPADPGSASPLNVSFWRVFFWWR